MVDYRPGAAACQSRSGKKDESAHGLTSCLIFARQKRYCSPKSLYISISAALFRFRLEVVQRYRKGIDTEQVQELKDSLDRIESEARSRGNVSQEILLEYFKGDDKATKLIEAMFVKWYGYRNDARNGRLDIAIKEINITDHSFDSMKGGAVYVKHSTKGESCRRWIGRLRHHHHAFAVSQCGLVRRRSYRIDGVYIRRAGSTQ
jgi:hypothetical protein